MRTLKALPVVFLVLLACAVRSPADPDALLKSLAPRGYVSDFAGVFATNELVQLNAFLKLLEDQTTAEIAVVTVKTLDGGEISDFANRLFAKWGIGQKKKDNGVLPITAVDDRKVWIEVGYGLEGAIPDARAGRVLDEQVVPVSSHRLRPLSVLPARSNSLEMVGHDANRATSSWAPASMSTRPVSPTCSVPLPSGVSTCRGERPQSIDGSMRVRMSNVTGSAPVTVMCSDRMVVSRTSHASTMSAVGVTARSVGAVSFGYVTGHRRPAASR